MTLAGDPGDAKGAGLVSAERLARGPAPGVSGVDGEIRSKIKGIRAGHKRTWQWQMQNAVTTLEQLEEILELTPEERSGAERALAEGFSMRMTPYYIGLASKTDASCPIRRQAVPVSAEANEVPGDLTDPLGEVHHEVAPHLVQRYPDRCLLLATDRCAVYCRFCTRSRMVGEGGGAVPMAALAPAFAYLRAHPEVRDVIVSGGDPLAMGTDRIVRLVAELRSIDSLDTIRLATRVPVTLPQRITPELVRALRPHHPLWIMTHFNHPRELTPEAQVALRRLADGGFPVMNQTVLLRGINDNSGTLETLFRGLVRARVRPYYLLQMDPVRGTSHMRTPLATGLRIAGELQGRLTGIALPKFIVDTPGGKGKVPLVAENIVRRGEGVTTLRTFRGEEVDYLDPPT